jgi:microcystin-dependent protein
MADSYLGEVRTAAFNVTPAGWAACDGRVLEIRDYERLYRLVGTAFGGDGVDTFALPDLQGRIPICAGQGGGLTDRTVGEKDGVEEVALTESQLPRHGHDFTALTDKASSRTADGNLLASPDGIDLYILDKPATQMNGQSLSPAGQGQPHSNTQPYLVLNYIISLEGDDPTADERFTGDPQPFLGEIRLMATENAGTNFAPCDGRLVPISQNTALFSLISTTYGGNGQVTFALPNLSDRTAMGAGTGAGLTPREIGETGGDPEVTLQLAQTSHDHALLAANQPAELRTPTPELALARSGAGLAYRAETRSLARMSDKALPPIGGGQPHNNVQPSLALEYMICVDGVFPDRG